MIRGLCSLVAVLIAAFAAEARAAPQILGLVATAGPVPMQCDGGRCTALLSAFCLQKERLPPDFGTAYTPYEGAQITVVVTAAGGESRRLNGAGLLEFRSDYGYTAIRAGLPLSAIVGEEPVSVALEVGPRVSMLPRPVAEDSAPLTDAEIALATGPLRLAAESVLEGGSETARTARTTVALVNALPESGDMPRAGREAVWSRIAAADAPAAARHTFEACSRTVDQSVGYSLRKCLEERHEQLQVENTRAYWDSLAGF